MLKTHVEQRAAGEWFHCQVLNFLWRHFYDQKEYRQWQNAVNLFFTITKTIFSVEEFIRNQLKTQTRVNSTPRQPLKQQTSTIIFQFGMFFNLPFDVFLDRKFNLKLSDTRFSLEVPEQNKLNKTAKLSFSKLSKFGFSQTA